MTDNRCIKGEYICYSQGARLENDLSCWGEYYPVRVMPPPPSLSLGGFVTARCKIKMIKMDESKFIFKPLLRFVDGNFTVI